MQSGESDQQEKAPTFAGAYFTRPVSISKSIEQVFGFGDLEILISTLASFDAQLQLTQYRDK